MDNPYESKWADTLGYKTHYIEAGEGHPVILIHGGGPGADGFGNWFGCLPVFAEKYRAIAIDLVGYGGTEPGPDHVHSQGNRNEQLIAFIEALGLPPVTIVGNSMGGATGIGATLKRPDLIRDLVLMGSAGLNYSVGRVAESMQTIKKFDYTIEGMRGVARHLGGDRFLSLPGMLDYRYGVATRPERKASFTKIDEWIWANQGLHYEEDEIATIKQRCLVVGGKDDPIAILPQTFRFLELLENSTGYIIPHCRHWAMLEYPELFTSQSIQFIDGHAA